MRKNGNRSWVLRHKFTALTLGIPVVSSLAVAIGEDTAGPYWLVYMVIWSVMAVGKLFSALGGGGPIGHAGHTTVEGVRYPAHSTQARAAQARSDAQARANRT